MFSGSGNQEVPFSALKAEDSELELVSKTRMRLLMTEEEEAKQGRVQCLPGGKVIGQCHQSWWATSKVLCKVLALSCQSRNLLRCQHTFPHTCYSGWQSHLELAVCWSAQACPSLSCQSSKAPPIPFLVVQALHNPPCFPVSVLASYACSKLTTNPVA